jgi:hypothetical protein
MILSKAVVLALLHLPSHLIQMTALLSSRHNTTALAICEPAAGGDSLNETFDSLLPA